VKAIVNGIELNLSSPLTLLDLIEQYRLKADTVIITLNDSVVKRASWTETMVDEGDCVELISLVGGG
jgi:thiamine biosynthesis protein ThiS